jgi:hypothetical protein
MPILLVNHVKAAVNNESAAVTITAPTRDGSVKFEFIRHDWHDNPGAEGAIFSSTTEGITADMNSAEKADKIKDQILNDVPNINIQVTNVEGGVILTITSTAIGTPEVHCKSAFDGTGQQLKINNIDMPNFEHKNKAKLNGSSSSGSATLCEDGVCKTVTTDGKTVQQIYSEWQSQFGEGTVTPEGFELPSRDTRSSSFEFEVTDPNLTMEVTQSYIREIPTVSEWGLIIMTMLLLTVGAVVIMRRRRVAI